MERGVIETFDLLRPTVKAHFLLSDATRRHNLPVLGEIRGRGLDHSFFSDTTDWPRIGRPRTFSDCRQMVIAMIRGNRDVLRAARGKDFIYIPSLNYFYFAFVAAFLHRLFRRRLIYHFHDLINNSSWGLRLVSLFTTDFVHNTQAGLDLVTPQNRFLRRTKNWIIPLPVAARLNKNDDRPTKAYGVRNILFVGQIATHKGVDLLLDAFQRLRQSRGDVVLHIAGGCNDRELESRMSQNSTGNGSGIKYWGYQSDVLRLMRMADVYIHPSPPSRFQESFGRGIVEAMSVGTPAVCFRSGALEEIVINGKTGLLCEDETATCLAENIGRLLSDDELREQCSRGSLLHYQSHYANERARARWLDLFMAAEPAPSR